MAERHFDLVVVGGGQAGCAAAHAGARGGRSVLFVEAAGSLGALAAVRRQGEFRDAERFLHEALAQAREGRPDLLLHAGDLIDFTSGHCGSAIRMPPQMPDFGLEGQNRKYSNAARPQESPGRHGLRSGCCAG